MDTEKMDTEKLKYTLADCGCYVDEARGIYAIDAIIVFVESHGAKIEDCSDHKHEKTFATSRFAGCHHANDIEDECDDYMNTNFPVDGAYWGRSEQGDWGLWQTEDRETELQKLNQLINEHQEDIRKQAIATNSLPGLVEWFEYDLVESMDVIFTSDIEKRLRNAFEFSYHINLNERGSFSADVRDCFEHTVFNIKAGDELGEDETSIFEDGYMRNIHDMAGLTEYLRDLKVIPACAEIADQQPNER